MPRPTKIPKRESDIENAFVRYAATRGCVAEKLVCKGKRNFPDRTIFCPRGRLLIIEFKMPGEEPTEGQARKIRELRAKGFSVFVCDSIEGACKLLDDFLMDAAPRLRVRPKITLPRKSSWPD